VNFWFGGAGYLDNMNEFSYYPNTYRKLFNERVFLLRVENG
jgi:hypothetical protein